MNDIAELMFDRFGFKYKKIPVGYIRDRLSYALSHSEDRKGFDIDYMKLLYGYMAAVGTAKDAPLLRKGLSSCEDPFLQRCTEVLEGKAGRRAVIREFRAIFKKQASRRGTYFGFSDELTKDGFFMFFAAAAFIMAIIPVMCSVAIHEYSIRIIPFLIPASVVAGIAVFRAAYLIPRGYVRAKNVTAAFGYYLILTSILLIVHESLFIPSEDGNGGLVFLATVPFAVLCFLFAYVYEIRAMIFCKKEIQGRIASFRQANTRTAPARTPSGGMNTAAFMEVTYIYEGMSYYKRIDSGRLIFRKAVDFKRGDYTELLVDPKHPECVRKKDAVPFFSCILVLIGIAILIGSMISTLV